MKKIIEAEIPLTVLAASCLDLESRSQLSQYKAKKWALQVVHRWLARYGSSPFRSTKSEPNKVSKRLGDHFVNNWSSVFMETIVLIFKAEKENSNNIWLSDDIKNYSLQYLTQSLELSLTYKALKPHIEFLLYDVCFPLLCYSADDVEKWQMDPADFIKCHEFELSGGPRDCGT